ncbi:MAG TPA: ATP--guanido phosphotransferase [Eubacteriales bacterium]|nr:ATP--guanido phosphotransferase [Clostridia bacterium]HRR89482.1 ATP--guanido phosphotransferase [Eubacteriales bacterium]HRU84392.1 ATP--guanido phosphotransferase [Eubacteriales bacterium]
MNDTVLSSRVRLARNQSGTLFPNQRTAGLKSVIAAAARAADGLMNYRLYFMKNMTALQKQSFVEKHFISPRLASNSEFGALILRDDENVSIMLNEEDHVRAQCILEGLQLLEAYAVLSEFDKKLEREMDIAFDERLGYLTACPTNVGTGMRASVMMFLPALYECDKTALLFGSLSELDYEIRGLYGEGTKAHGNMYQISNRRSLGLSEEDILEGVLKSAFTISAFELAAREELTGFRGIAARDRILKGFELVFNLRRLTAAGLMELISDIKLGVILQILPFIDLNKLDKLVESGEPANLCLYAGRELNADERDIVRAELVRYHVARLAKIPI